MDAKLSRDQFVAKVLQENCRAAATHVFRQGDNAARRVAKTDRHKCGDLGTGRGDREVVYVCDKHCEALLLLFLFLPD